MSVLPRPTQRIYLDHAAATPLHPAVAAAMQPFLTELFGNPSAIHAEGQAAKAAIEEARTKIARLLGIKTGGVIFTGSGTESNNLAIAGYLAYLAKTGREYSEMEILTTKIEHPSILALLPSLEAKGATVRYLAVDEVGEISNEALAAALSLKTVLVTFAYANSEVGTVQPVTRLVRKIRQYERTHHLEIAVHLDAAQAPLWLPCEFEQLGIDFLSLDAGKCRGPKGVGVLGARHPEKLLPILWGGGQEAGKRPGTENVAGIVGAAAALQLASLGYEARSAQVAAERDKALELIAQELPEAVINGPLGTRRLANNINLSLPAFDTEFAVVYLDSEGVAASTKSACAGAGSGVSHVVEELTKDPKRAKATIRLSLGEETTAENMEYVVQCLVNYCQKMKALTR